MSEPTPVSKVLDILNIPHKEFTHPGTVHSLEQAAQERNQEIYQVVRSIVFRLSNEKYAMVLMAGPRQISWKKLRAHFGQSRLTMASPDEVLTVTGYEVGSVSPFGLPEPMPILIDKILLSQKVVSIGSGVRGKAIFLDTKELVKAVGEYEVGEFGAD